MSKELGEIVVTADGSLTLKHPEHGENYHSHLGAHQEARDLYINGSGFVAALENSQPLGVLDVGLGLGYNALITIESWLLAKRPPDIFLLSLEINPALVAALASGQAPWQKDWAPGWIDNSRKLQKLGTEWVATFSHPSGTKLRWQVIVGDALKAELSSPTGGFDFIWQDAFSPTKNPTLWSAEWFQKLAKSSHAGTVLVTYSVARMVKDALSASGWRWEKIPGVVTKKHWLKATL